jgi:hypothetical protein
MRCIRFATNYTHPAGFRRISVVSVLMIWRNKTYSAVKRVKMVIKFIYKIYIQSNNMTQRYENCHHGYEVVFVDVFFNSSLNYYNYVAWITKMNECVKEQWWNDMTGGGSPSTQRKTSPSWNAKCEVSIIAITDKNILLYCIICVCQQTVVKHTNIVRRQNLFSGSWVLICNQMDEQTLWRWNPNFL